MLCRMLGILKSVRLQPYYITQRVEYVDWLTYNLAQKNCCYRPERSIHQSVRLGGKQESLIGSWLFRGWTDSNLEISNLQPTIPTRVTFFDFRWTGDIINVQPLLVLYYHGAAFLSQVQDMFLHLFCFHHTQLIKKEKKKKQILGHKAWMSTKLSIMWKSKTNSHDFFSPEYSLHELYPFYCAVWWKLTWIICLTQKRKHSTLENVLLIENQVLVATASCHLQCLPI